MKKIILALIAAVVLGGFAPAAQAFPRARAYRNGYYAGTYGYGYGARPYGAYRYGYYGYPNGYGYARPYYTGYRGYRYNSYYPGTYGYSPYGYSNNYVW